MALWGKTDTLADAPKWLNANDPNASNDLDYALFVDTTEAIQEENRDKGLKTPGWNLYREYTNSNGDVRRMVEPLIVMKVTAADAGDDGITANTQIEDATVVDRTITITVQPQDASVVASNTAIFSVTASVEPSSALSYQWQIQQSGAGAWANVSTGSGGTTATYTTGATAVAPGSGATNGDKFRVLVSASGATTVTSDAATLTVTA